MKEPFKVIKRSERSEVPSFSASRIGSEYWSFFLDLTDPEPITDELNEIFDAGNVVHHYDEIYSEGGRGIVSCESYIKAIHESEKFCISGLHDYIKLDRNGLYIEDLKSTIPGGLYWFFKKGVDDGYKLQLSVYAYLYYLKHGVWIDTGVITKINKENTRDRISLSAKLFPLEYIRDVIVNHPVMKTISGEMTEKELLSVAYAKLKEIDPEWAKGNRKEAWVCKNCQYKGRCELLLYIEELDEHII